MSDNTEMVLHENNVQLGTIQADGPSGVVVQATAIAHELKNIIVDRKLYKKIKGKNYVYVDAWTTMGAMLGVLPREVEVVEHDDGSYEATVELIRASDGAVIGRGSAICGMDESTWASRPRYARRSMAITRATGKAFRLGYSWIITLAGYAPTPAEEMTDDVVDGNYTEVSQPAPVAQPKADYGERPFEPNVLKQIVSKKVDAAGEYNASDKQRGLLRGSLELLFAGDPAAEQKYRTVARELTGVDSTSKMTGAQIKALLDWVDVTEDSGGSLKPGAMAVKEARMVENAALLDAGQTELPV